MSKVLRTESTKMRRYIVSGMMISMGVSRSLRCYRRVGVCVWVQHELYQRPSVEGTIS